MGLVRRRPCRHASETPSSVDVAGDHPREPGECFGERRLSVADDAGNAEDFAAFRRSTSCLHGQLESPADVESLEDCSRGTGCYGRRVRQARADRRPTIAG